MKRLIILFALLLVACTVTQPQGPVQAPATTTFTPQALTTSTFSSEQQLKAFLQDNTGNGAVYNGGGVMDTSALVKGAESQVAPSAPIATAPSGVPDFSTTNNQVAAVDEADSTKNDGNYIYTITGQTVFIVDAYPGENASVVSTIDYDKETPTALFVLGDRLAVFGQFYDNDYFRTHSILPYDSMTFLKIYDITDRSKPKQIEDDKFEGSYVEARLLRNTMYLVLTSPANSDQPRPLIIRNDVVEKMPVENIRYYPYPYNSVEYAIVHSIDLTQPQDQKSLAVLVESNPTVYMSQDNIYLASSEYINEYEITQDVTMDTVQLTSDEQALVDRIKAIDSDILSKDEKRQKILEVYQRHVQYLSEQEQNTLQNDIETEVAKRMETYESSTYTALTKIAASDLSVAATASVAGSVNDQFSLDEYDGVLRVTTTLNPFSSLWIRPMMAVDNTVTASGSAGVAVGSAGSADAAPATEQASAVAVAAPAAPDEKSAVMPIIPPKPATQTTNRIYTLDSNLNVLDTFKDVAPGESIYSSRFIGARLYLVTFRQVDPFFVFDLSDPSNIKELGSLKVPGFSRYLHPYSDNIVIGIGRDASPLGQQQALKISLFDVTNVSKPVEIAKWEASDDYSQSTAEYEHKAFLFDKDKQLLVIPAYSYAYDMQGGHQRYNGAMVFNINQSSITLRGIIDHSTSQDYYSPLVERSLWIDDLLYTKSPTLLRINRISDLGSVKNVTLSSAKAGPYPIY